MNKLNHLRAQYASLPSRGSSAWYESRRTKIGGSEIAACVGRCPYKKPAQLLSDKRKCVRLKAPACTFGRLFEPVAKVYIERAQQTTVHELGAIPSTRFPVCYSPDGVVVEGEELVLVEIKCPFRRNRIAKVPSHYLCQIQTGMDILPCERTYFYQFRFRACKIRDLGPNPSYNRDLHCEAVSRAPPVHPITWGFLHWDVDCPLVDLGVLRGPGADKLCSVDGKPFTQHHETSKMPINGWVLPWKLLDFSKVDVPRDPGFLDANGPALWKAYGALVEGRK